MEAKEILDQIKGQTEEMITKKGFVTKAEYDTLIETKMNEVKGMNEKAKAELMDILVKQGAEITAMKDRGVEPVDYSVRAQVKSYHEKHKDLIAKVKSGQKVELPAFELKGAPTSPMVPSSALNSSAYFPVPEINTQLNDLRRVQPTFWDFLPKGRTAQAAYVWVNKTDANGSPAFIGAGVAKPGVSFELTSEISNAKKIAASLKIATELLDDIDGMTSFIEGELSYTLKKVLNTTLMTGTSSSTVPAGIQTFSDAFTLSGVSTSDPDEYDCIVAATTQVRTAYIDSPLTVFINPQDFAKLKITFNKPAHRIPYSYLVFTGSMKVFIIRVTKSIRIMSKLKQIGYLVLSLVFIVASFVLLGFVCKVIYQLIKLGWSLI